VVVRAIQLRSLDSGSKPPEEFLVPDVHPHGHLRLKTVPAEVTLACENSHKETLIEIGHHKDSTGCLFHRQVSRETLLSGEA